MLWEHEIVGSNPASPTTAPGPMRDAGRGFDFIIRAGAVARIDLIAGLRP